MNAISAIEPCQPATHFGSRMAPDKRLSAYAEKPDPIVDIEPYRPVVSQLAITASGRARASYDQHGTAPLIVLLRQSDKRSSDLSIPRQRHLTQRAAHELGREIVKEFEEDDVSGRLQIHERVVLREALQFIDKRMADDEPIAGIMVEAVHRLARRTSVAHHIWEFLEDRGLHIWMTSYPAPLTRAQFDQEASRATENWQETLKTLHEGRRQGAELGRHMRAPIWGYKQRFDIRSDDTRRIERGRWKVHEREADDVLYAFQLFAYNDLSVEEVILALIEAEIEPPKGSKSWTAARLIGVPGTQNFGYLGNLAYVGWVLYDWDPRPTVALATATERKPVEKFVPEYVVIRDARLWKMSRAKVERIHAEKLAETAARQADRPAAKRLPPEVKPYAEVLLKDKVHCACCSERLSVVASRKASGEASVRETDAELRWFGHPKSVGKRAPCGNLKTLSVDLIDAAVLMLTERALGEMDGYIDRLSTNLAREQRKLENDKRKLVMLIQDKTRFLEDVDIECLRESKRGLAQSALARFDKLEAELRVLQRRLKNLEDTVPPVVPDLGEAQALRSALEQVRRALPFEAGTAAELTFRRHLGGLIDQVEVRKTGKRSFELLLRGPVVGLLCDDPEIPDPEPTEWSFEVRNRRAGEAICDRIGFAY